MNAALREEALEYLWRQFPNHCLLLTDPQALVFVDLGLARAASHGYRQRGDVFAFLALMLFLGSSFDVDMQHAWAAEMLARRPPMTALYAKAVEVQEPIIGARGEFYRRALLWSCTHSFADLAARAELADQAAGQMPRVLIASWLKDMYKHKYLALGVPLRERLIAHIEERAQALGLNEPAGLLTLAALIFLLGSGVERDPLYPWIAQSLAEAGPVPAQRAERLHCEAIAQMERFMRLDRFVRGR